MLLERTSARPVGAMPAGGQPAGALRSLTPADAVAALAASDMPARGPVSVAQGWEFAAQGLARLGLATIRERRQLGSELLACTQKTSDPTAQGVLYDAIAALYGGQRRHQRAVDVVSSLTRAGAVWSGKSR
ncbi:hypothetical protein [Candidatus Frankia alpina]|uniref:Uncharacterized protein n=1 Tax=Candidatus Frankia alpina TaxID=2699483 RepID=A0A4S5CX30_9ACTN|nr:hypothetical protein [Candidatus Frankia alpina]THJ49653.1 hypothetical protein E7Y31_18900 [Candidatus Frankia alpina]